MTLNSRLKISLAISNIATFLFSMFATFLMCGMTFRFNKTTTYLILSFESLMYVFLFYFLYKNFKLYVFYGLILHLLVAPIYYLLIYDVIHNCYISFSLGHYLYLIDDFTNIIYLSVSIAYLFSIYQLTRLVINALRKSR